MGFLETLKRTESADRRLTIGASAAPAILGLSPWQSAMGVWMQMQGLDTANKSTAVTRRGNYLERGLLHWTAAEVDATMVEDGIPISEPGIAGPEPWMQFHPDGALANKDGWHLAEIKTSRMAAEWGDGPDEIPPHYLCQVQFQLACLPAGTAAIVGAYLPIADKMLTYRILPDVEFQTWLIETIGEWYYQHIVLGRAPDVDGSEASRKWLQHRHPSMLLPMRIADMGEERELIANFASVKAEIKALEAREAELANLLRAACGDGEGIFCGEGKITCRPVKGAERADLETLRRDFPDVWTAVKRKSDDRRDLRFWPAK